MPLRKATYYFVLDTRPQSQNYMKPTTVHRWYHTNDGAFTEMWNGKEWEDNPSLIAATGIGGDNDYYETTEKEAMEFIRTHIPPEEQGG